MLYIVATPLGNLEDFSKRALTLIQNADVIFHEERNAYLRLKEKFSLSPKELFIYSDFRDQKQFASFWAETLKRFQDKTMVVLSSAGTPCIRDPGYTVVNAAYELGIPVSPVPGPCAFVSLASVSGLNLDHLIFRGFFPKLQKNQEKELEYLENTVGSVAYYVSCHHLREMIYFLSTNYPQSLPAPTCVLGKELTKIHEQLFRGELMELQHYIQDLDVIKGEYTFLMQTFGAQTAEAEDVLKYLFQNCLDQDFRLSETAKILSGHTKLKRAEVYKLLEALKG